ncbi:AAA family ATPase [Dyadobacter bucti]|uniref:AAA family ATPase n=1 Tax=Dyadobacter bucti TaxID=2572203 RepID=UPI00110935EA|nr:AAA family ATPase [Dyadobacter bucti]
MTRIKIRNFGPIQGGLQEDDGWIDVKKVTVFIGNQGSGKSTIAKLISTLIWIEKALVRGDYNKKWFERKNRFKNQCLAYHRIENYLKDKGDNHTRIEYLGDAYDISYFQGQLSIKEREIISYPLPQIMYVPAERNFITYVKTPKELKLSSDSLKEFLTEFDNAKSDMRGMLRLPINDVNLEYDRLNDVLNLRGDAYRVRLTEASSGFQSLVPLFLVSDYLGNSVKRQSVSHRETMTTEELARFKSGVEDIFTNESLTDEQKRAAISILSSKFNKTAFINIVEEPEQNLFPSSQWQMLESLLKINNMNNGNKLILTTHSPYLIMFLNLAIQGNYVKDKIIEAKKIDKILPKLSNVLSIDALVSSESVVVYQLLEISGEIKKLPAPFGIQSDKNFLNEMLREGNKMFDSLLEIEEDLTV